MQMTTKTEVLTCTLKKQNLEMSWVFDPVTY